MVVLAARLVDRIGKGIRGAPRDALVADITPPEVRGAAYGLRQGLDSVGAFAGPLLAVLLMVAYANRIRTVLWWAVLPAMGSVILILLFVREPAGLRRAERRGWPVRRGDFSALGGVFWAVIAIGVVFTLARFSEAFLILDGQAAGLPLTFVPLVMVCMNAAYATAAVPAGALSDRLGRHGLLATGMLVLAGADLVLALWSGIAGLFVGAGLWGLHMALSQGLLAALVADTAPVELRGTAFGLFNLATGLTLLLASVIAGALWGAFGPTATFGAGGAFAAIAGGALALFSRVQHRQA